MPRSRTGSSFPLSGSSRSRRRLISAQSEAVFSDVENEIDEEEFEEAVTETSDEVSESSSAVSSELDLQTLGQQLQEFQQREQGLLRLKNELAERESSVLFREVSLEEKESEIRHRESELSRRENQIILSQQQLRQAHSQLEANQSQGSNLYVIGREVLEEVRRMLRGDSSVTWVFTGEIHAATSSSMKGRRDFTEHFAERVRGELRRSLDVVINTGVTGNNTRELLETLETRATRFQPDVVSVLVGPSDTLDGKSGRTRFYDNLCELITRMDDEGTKLMLHTPNRIPVSSDSVHADLRGYIKILREVAVEYDVPLIDHWAYWKKKKPSDDALKTWLAADQIRPSVNGHRAMARLLFAALEIMEPSAITDTNFGPPPGTDESTIINAIPPG